MRRITVAIYFLASLLISWSGPAAAAEPLHPLHYWRERRARLDGSDFMLRRHRKPHYHSEYFSRRKLPPTPRVNLAEPGRVGEVIAARSFKNETIVACFMGDSWSIRWMVQFARMLQNLGYDHFIPVAHTEAACTQLERAWCSGLFDSQDPGACAGKDLRALLFPGCAWLDAAAAGADLGPRHNLWRETSRMDEVMRLWLVRYFVASEALQRGVNVLMADTDVVVWDDFYAHVKRPPLSDFHYINMMSEPGPNGGLWYAQNCHPAGPVSQLLAETVRRILAAAFLYGRESPEQQREQSSLRYSCSWQDQTVLAEAVLAASTNRSFLLWECLLRPVSEEAWREAFGSLDALPRPFGDPQRQFTPWRLDWVEIDGVPFVGDPPRLPDLAKALQSPFFTSPNAPRVCRPGEVNCAERLRRFQSLTAVKHRPERLPLRVPAGFTPLPRPPEDGDPGPGEGGRLLEWAIRGPQYLMDHTESLVLQWNDRAPTWSLITHLVAFPEAWGPESPDRNNRVQQIQARGRWAAPVRMPSRVLRVGPRLLSAALALPDDPGGDGTGPLRQLLKSLAVLAAVLVRAPVVPAVECGRLRWAGTQPWVLSPEDEPNGYARLGVHDKRLVIYQREVAAVVSERRRRGVQAPAAARREGGAAADEDSDGDGWEWEEDAGGEAPGGDGAGGGAGGGEAAGGGAGAGEPPVMCSPYFSAGDRCLDPVLLSDFHLDQDLRYPSYTQGTLDVTEGVDIEGGGLVARVLEAARRGDLAAHNGSRVLWLEGDAAAVLRVSRDARGLLGALTYEEKRYLDEFYEWCRDYNKPTTLTREQLGHVEGR